MNMNSKNFRIFGLASIIALTTAISSSIALLFKKKNPCAVIVAMLAVEAAIAATFMYLSSRFGTKHKILISADEEMSPSELESINESIDRDLGNSVSRSGTRTRSIRHDIPKDEDATEADFI